ncbi:hypothetical protein JMUB7494_27510 [Staphylococcus aureus]
MGIVTQLQLMGATEFFFQKNRIYKNKFKTLEVLKIFYYCIK